MRTQYERDTPFSPARHRSIGDAPAPVIGNDVQVRPYCIAIVPVEVNENVRIEPHSQVHHTQRATSLAAQSALTQNWVSGRSRHRARLIPRPWNRSSPCTYMS